MCTARNEAFSGCQGRARCLARTYRHDDDAVLMSMNAADIDMRTQYIVALVRNLL